MSTDRLATDGDLRLGDVSYVVLGLLSLESPMTAYEMKRAVGESVGFFWSFPHSQIYAETKRLAAAGLLEEEVEEAGRRRRFYRLAEPGRLALVRWLQETDTAPVELRDEGLLKLFFCDAVSTDDVRALATAELAKHRHRLTVYEAIDETMTRDERVGVVGATLRRGRYAQEAAVRFWQELVDDPPSVRRDEG